MSRGLLAHARALLGMRREAWRVAAELRRAAEESVTAAEAFDAAVATGDGAFGIKPLQVRSELTDFATFLRREKPARILEIGTGIGGTLYVLAWASDRGARILSLDLRVYPEARRTLYRRFVGGGRRVEVIEADSHREAARDRIARFFHSQPIDLLFIDGDHGYESVARDYELHAPLVRDGGLIAFHDIVDGPVEAVGGVPRFWSEVRPSLADTREFVESWDQGGFGIGVGRRRSLTP